KTGNMIYYPELKINNTIKNRFKNIESKELFSNIESKLKENEAIYKEELDGWQSLAKKYKKGDFSNENEVFDINLEEVLIKLKIEKEGKKLEKILKFTIHIGN